MSQTPNQNINQLPNTFYIPAGSTIEIFDDEDQNDPFVQAWLNSLERRELFAPTTQNLMGSMGGLDGVHPMIVIDIMEPTGGLCPRCASHGAGAAGGALQRGQHAQGGQWVWVPPQGTQGEHTAAEGHANQDNLDAEGDETEARHDRV